MKSYKPVDDTKNGVTEYLTPIPMPDSPDKFANGRVHVRPPVVVPAMVIACAAGTKVAAAANAIKEIEYFTNMLLQC